MLACPCECNSGGFCGGCGHAGCTGGINLRRPAPPVCSGCHRPGGECPPREDPEACPHCGSRNPDILSHYHPYRATND